MYEVRNFGTGEIWTTDDVKFAYRVADGMYRATKTAVILKNLITGKILFNRCDNDFALDEWLKYLNDQPNCLLEITEAVTV